MAEQTSYSLIPPHLAVDAMRDNGYKNAAYAIAELMDNAIQAGADTVELLCQESQVRVQHRTTWQINTLAVADNGSGMDEHTLRIALQFGNGTHLHDRSGIGRFGMGLPNASISQCKHVDVWTWTDGPDNALYTYIDLDEVMRREYTSVPKPLQDGVPTEWRRCMGVVGQSGTLVVWSKLDRVMWRTARSIIQNSEQLIGRMYRYFLADDKVRIRLTHFTDEHPGVPGQYERWAQPNDPSYLILPSSTPDPFKNEPMFETFGSAIPKRIRFNGEEHTVRVEFACARREAREAPDGRPGALPHGRHAARNIGVSLVREGRELMLDPAWANEQPTERWWGVTVHMPAALDEIFGVSNNKQGARHFTDAAHIGEEQLLDGRSRTEVMEELDAAGDPLAILLEIAETVRSGIGQMRSLLGKQTEGQRRQRRLKEGGDPAARRATEATRQRQHEGHRGRSDEAEDKESPEERRRKLAEGMEEEGVPHKDAEKLAAQMIDSGLKYTFTADAMESPSFFTVRPLAGTLKVILNTQHPAYQHLFEVLDQEAVEEETDVDKLHGRLHNALNALKLLFMAWARFEDEQDGARREAAQEMRTHWGMIARRFLRNVDG